MTYVIKIYQTECRIYSVCSSMTNMKRNRDGLSSSKMIFGLQNTMFLFMNIENSHISSFL